MSLPNVCRARPANFRASPRDLMFSVCWLKKILDEKIQDMRSSLKNPVDFKRLNIIEENVYFLCKEFIGPRHPVSLFFQEGELVTESDHDEQMICEKLLRLIEILDRLSTPAEPAEPASLTLSPKDSAILSDEKAFTKIATKNRVGFREAFHRRQKTFNKDLVDAALLSLIPFDQLLGKVSKLSTQEVVQILEKLEDFLAVKLGEMEEIESEIQKLDDLLSNLFDEEKKIKRLLHSRPSQDAQEEILGLVKWVSDKKYEALVCRGSFFNKIEALEASNIPKKIEELEKIILCKIKDERLDSLDKYTNRPGARITTV